MDHHWPVRRVVRADIFQLEALRQVVIELHGSQLPLAADAIANYKIDLGAVERGFAFLGGVFHAHTLHDFEENPLRPFAQSSSVPTYFVLFGSRKPTRTR